MLQLLRRPYKPKNFGLREASEADFVTTIAHSLCEVLKTIQQLSFLLFKNLDKRTKL
jgi:hypothetical protein